MNMVVASAPVAVADIRGGGEVAVGGFGLRSVPSVVLATRREAVATCLEVIRDQELDVAFEQGISVDDFCVRAAEAESAVRSVRA